MMKAYTVECSIHIERHGHGAAKEMHEGAAEKVEQVLEPGRVPRVAKLLALAHRFEELVRAGHVASYAELAALGHVTRARISQIMSLLNLAPDIQEAILFLPRTKRGDDAIHLWQLIPIAAEPDWAKQRRLWRRLRGMHRS